MIKQIIYRFMQPRHFWRDAKFDELSELYASMLLKSFGQNILFIFVPFFLHQHGYSVQQIFLVYTSFFMIRVIGDPVGGFMVARIGPKHTQIFATILQIIGAAQFLTVPNHHWSVLQLGAVWGSAASLYFVSFHVQFSKIKHTIHSGKELGYMGMMDRIGAFAGPIVGGVVGTVISSQYIFLVAASVLIGSLWPLFLTSEPVKVHQKLNFRDFPLDKIRYDLISYCGLSIENTLCNNLWPLYIALFAISGGVYIKLGILYSAGVVFAIISTYTIGKLIDRRNARKILRFAATANALLYIARPFVSGVGGVFAVNSMNEVVTNAYRMPFVKGMYAAADEYPGFRIVYVVLMETVTSSIKGLFWLMLAILAAGFSDRTVIYIGFIFAAGGSMMILAERFKALRA